MMMLIQGAAYVRKGGHEKVHLRTGGGGGLKIAEILRTYFMNGPLGYLSNALDH